MRLRAQITIDIDAADYIEAARHQERLKLVADQIRGEYAHAVLELRERRQRESGRAAAPPKTFRPYTGKLSKYVDR